MVLSVFNCHYQVAASKCRCSPYSGFPNCPRPQLPATHFLQLKLSTDSNHNSSKITSNYFMTGGLPPISSSWRQAPWDSQPVILFSNWTLGGYSPYVIELLVLVVWPRHGQHRKHLFHYCAFSPCRGNNVSIELFPSNGCYAVTCLHSCSLAMSLHVTIFWEELKADQFIRLKSSDVTNAMNRTIRFALSIKWLIEREILSSFTRWHKPYLHSYSGIAQSV
jgi:hypothetical protein